MNILEKLRAWVALEAGGMVGLAGGWGGRYFHLLTQSPEFSVISSKEGL